jgi:malate dehydrogenase (oxaloacetate-decarboxylating)(NADP+)
MVLGFRKGKRYLLVKPDISSAIVAYQTIKLFGDALPISPVFISTARPARVLIGSVTLRDIINITVIAIVGCV